MSCFPLYYHPLYSEGLDRSARFPVDRYRLLADRLSFLDLDGKIDMKLPRLATREEILLVHDEDFVDRFLSVALSEKEVRLGHSSTGPCHAQRRRTKRTRRRYQLPGSVLESRQCRTCCEHGGLLEPLPRQLGQLEEQLLEVAWQSLQVVAHAALVPVATQPLVPQGNPLPVTGRAGHARLVPAAGRHPGGRRAPRARLRPAHDGGAAEPQRA